jgi:Family of unknown function (DUF5685)
MTVFGFLNPATHSDAYRAAYSRCCQHQRVQHGLRSLPFLSYEAIFVYLFWRDVVANKAPILANQRCCRLKPLEKAERQPDFEIGQFCGGLSMLLATTKIEDDLEMAYHSGCASPGRCWAIGPTRAADTDLLGSMRLSIFCKLASIRSRKTCHR